MLKYITILLALSFALSGCSDKGGAASGGSASGGTTKNANGATVTSDVPRDGIPEGGIVMKPANPDDPKFKPDPRLAGGGGN